MWFSFFITYKIGEEKQQIYPSLQKSRTSLTPSKPLRSYTRAPFLLGCNFLFNVSSLFLTALPRVCVALPSLFLLPVSDLGTRCCVCETVRSFGPLGFASRGACSRSMCRSWAVGAVGRPLLAQSAPVAILAAAGEHLPERPSCIPRAEITGS